MDGAPHEPAPGEFYQFEVGEWVRCATLLNEGKGQIKSYEGALTYAVRFTSGLIELCREADLWPDARPGQTMHTTGIFEDLFSAAELAGRPVPARQWLVPDMIPARTVTLLGGDGGTGKSLLALQLAVAAVAGLRWIGLPVTTGPALFLSAEDEEDELHRRLADVAEGMGIDLARLRDLRVLSLAGKDALLATVAPKDNKLKRTDLLGQIEKVLHRHRPALLVLDTLADLYGGNENDRAQVRQFVGILRGIAMRHNCAVVLLAHPSLSGLSSGSGTSGSTAWNASVRSRLYLERVVVEGYEADPKARRLSTKKANYGPTGAEIGLRWDRGLFHREEAETGLDTAAASAKAERVFLKLLSLLNEQGRDVNAKGGSGYAPKVFAEHPEAEGVTKRAFAAAMEVLLTAGKVVVEHRGPTSRRVSYLTVGGA